MRMNTLHNPAALSNARPRRRPDHPEDYGRGPFWRLAELFFLGFTFPPPPPVVRFQWGDEDDDDVAQA